jgi:hypothetical protein
MLTVRPNGLLVRTESATPRARRVQHVTSRVRDGRVEEVRAVVVHEERDALVERPRRAGPSARLDEHARPRPTYRRASRGRAAENPIVAARGSRTGESRRESISVPSRSNATCAKRDPRRRHSCVSGRERRARTARLRGLGVRELEPPPFRLLTKSICVPRGTGRWSDRPHRRGRRNALRGRPSCR